MRRLLHRTLRCRHRIASRIQRIRGPLHRLFRALLGQDRVVQGVHVVYLTSESGFGCPLFVPAFSLMDCIGLLAQRSCRPPRILAVTFGNFSLSAGVFCIFYCGLERSLGLDDSTTQFCNLRRCPLSWCDKSDGSNHEPNSQPEPGECSWVFHLSLRLLWR